MSAMFGKSRTFGVDHIIPLQMEFPMHIIPFLLPIGQRANGALNQKDLKWVDGIPQDTKKIASEYFTLFYENLIKYKEDPYGFVKASLLSIKTKEGKTITEERINEIINIFENNPKKILTMGLTESGSVVDNRITKEPMTYGEALEHLSAISVEAA